MTVRYALKCTTDILQFNFFFGGAYSQTPPPSQVSYCIMCPGKWLKHYHMYDRRPCHTKVIIKMVQDSSVLSSQHTRIGLDYLSSQN